MDIFSRPGPAPSLLLNLEPLTDPEARHLAKVFVVLTLGALVTVCGVLVHNWFNIGGMFSFLVSLFCLTRVFESRHIWKHRLYFIAFEGTKGLSLGYFTSMFMESQPILLAVTLAGILSVFACFSVVSMFTRERKHLYLTSILGSAIIYVALILVLDIYLDFVWAYDYRVFACLIVFVGYILIETQCALERKHNPNKHGWRTHYQHAADFYIDFAAIICRLVQILVRKRRQSWNIPYGLLLWV